MKSSKEQHIEMKEAEQGIPMHLEAPKSDDLVIKQKSFLDLNKDDIRTIAMAVVDKATDGYGSATEGLIFAKKITEMAELIKENLSDAATNELKLSKGEKSVQHNVEINEQMVGVKYSYTGCNDPVWNELNEKIKNREAFLKTIKGSKQELIEETGEVVQLFEPTKSGKLALIIKVK